MLAPFAEVPPNTPLRHLSTLICALLLSRQSLKSSRCLDGPSDPGTSPAISVLGLDRRETEATIEEDLTVDAVTNQQSRVASAMDECRSEPGEFSGSRIDRGLGCSSTCNRDAYPSSAQVKNRREGVQTQASSEVSLGEGRISHGGSEGCAQDGGMMPKPGSVRRTNGESRAETGGHGEACGDEAPTTGRLRNQEVFDVHQDVPPSPLPSPPVPCSPTTRGKAPTLRQLLPRRGMRLPPSKLMQQPRMHAAPFRGYGNGDIVDISAAAQNDVIEEEITSRKPADRFSMGHAYGPVVNGGGGSRKKLREELLEEMPQEMVACLQQSSFHRGGQVPMPETPVTETASQATVPLKPRRRETSNALHTTPSSSSVSPSGKIEAKHSPSEQRRLVGTGSTALRYGLHDGVRISRGTSYEATPTADRNPMQRGHNPKIAAVLVLQRWVRCVIVGRERVLGAEASACLCGKPRPKMQSQGSSASTPLSVPLPRGRRTCAQ